MRRGIQRNFRAFFGVFEPARNYVYGRHTIELIETLQYATYRLERGECVYIVVAIPPRHGKSDVTSRRYPCWHLGRNPDHEIILCSYNFTLASEMSYDARECMREYGPMIGLSCSKTKSSIESWRIEGHKGRVHATGLGGTITGRGAHVLLIDDYFKNREQAESETMRNKCWESFESDLLTRLAPVHAVIIVANRWHYDDIVGRIEKKNNPESETYDADFPVFEQIKYPALNEETGEFLMPERFPEKYYKSMRAFMGAYAWQAQAQQNPGSREGKLFAIENVIEVPADEMPDISYMRVWDLASTKKERIKQDPDYSAGALIGVLASADMDELPWLCIKDVAFCREQAPKRDALIRATAKLDGPAVSIGVEAVGGYLDTYQTLRAALKNQRMVFKITVSNDKVERNSPMEALFEAGRVKVPAGASWLPKFYAHFGAFPSPGEHDDIVDAVGLGFRRQSRFIPMRAINRAALGI